MIERYRLNYGWGHQPGWTEDTEITLLAHVDGAAATAAVRTWFEGLPACERPHEAGRRYDGGATMQILIASPDGLELAIRSMGQDAFDAVAWYADVVTDLVVAAQRTTDGPAGRARLAWTEVPVG